MAVVRALVGVDRLEVDKVACDAEFVADAGAACKRRGFCPSCGARRMALTAAHLEDHVIPYVPVRQWVLSLPVLLRVLLASQPKLVTPVLQVAHRMITRQLLEQAGLEAQEADCGTVMMIHRFESAANLNNQLHCLVLNGVYRRNEAGTVFGCDIT